MTKSRFINGLAILLITILILGCNKDHGTPTIRFVPGTGFTGKDTIIKVNYLITVTMEVNWNGTDSLQLLEVQQDGSTRQTYAVSADKAIISLDILKGTLDTETWTFIIKDVKANQSSVSLKLTKDPNSEYGAITYYSPVTLGAQGNTAKGGFIGFQTTPATIYSLENAFANQSKTDILFYSDAATNATLASPGSDIPDNLYPGSRNIALWAVRNAARFMKSTMSVQDFVSISSDAPILNGWSDAQSVTRAGDLKVDDIWLVKLQNGKKAAILVKRIVAGEAGEIDFGIKIQK
jgi:hypothetical protein